LSDQVPSLKVRRVLARALDGPSWAACAGAVLAS
jgi:hypothetical protein